MDLREGGVVEEERVGPYAAGAVVRSRRPGPRQHVSGGTGQRIASEVGNVFLKDTVDQQIAHDDHRGARMVVQIERTR